MPSVFHGLLTILDHKLAGGGVPNLGSLPSVQKPTDTQSQGTGFTLVLHGTGARAEKWENFARRDV